jgi:hypothetical protein
VIDGVRLARAFVRLARRHPSIRTLERQLTSRTTTTHSSSTFSDSTAPLLAAVSAAQLGAGLLGLLVALKRRHAYDFLFLHGCADHVARDALFMGTALSAPAPMLVTQTVATARLLSGAGGYDDVVLATLGAAMVAGYLGEALVRRRLQRSGFDVLESPLAVAGVTLAAAMAVLGLRGRRPSRP